MAVSSTSTADVSASPGGVSGMDSYFSCVITASTPAPSTTPPLSRIAPPAPASRVAEVNVLSRGNGSPPPPVEGLKPTKRVSPCS